MKRLILLVIAGGSFIAADINAQFLYNNDFPTNQIAAATRPQSGFQFEIETGDDFLLPAGGRITGATFTGLAPQGSDVSNIGKVVVEIYRVFPTDSDVTRTSGSPTFSTPNVPTRVNSPSDVAFDSRESGTGLTFTPSVVNPTFTVNNSVQPLGIHPKPNQTTGGDESFTGEEIHFAVDFTSPFNLPSDHYFFVPQVELTGTDGTFLWLSATRPLVPPSSVFAPDLQAWTRDGTIEPDWLRIGTDIVGGMEGNPAPTFNASFSISGTPDSGSTLFLLSSAVAIVFVLRRRART